MLYRAEFDYIDLFLSPYQVPSGVLDRPDSVSEFVPTSYHEGFLVDMFTSHMVQDFAIVGPRVSRFYTSSF